MVTLDPYAGIKIHLESGTCESSLDVLDLNKPAALRYQWRSFWTRNIVTTWTASCKISDERPTVQNVSWIRRGGFLGHWRKSMKVYVCCRREFSQRLRWFYVVKDRFLIWVWKHKLSVLEAAPTFLIERAIARSKFNFYTLSTAHFLIRQVSWKRRILQLCAGRRKDRMQVMHKLNFSPVEYAKLKYDAVSISSLPWLLCINSILAPLNPFRSVYYVVFIPSFCSDRQLDRCGFAFGRILPRV